MMTVLAWNNARQLIREAMTVGTSLGRDGTSPRDIVEVDHQCNRYDYGGERGFEVRIGVTATLDIPWSMLETCFTELVSVGYDSEAFGRHYPDQKEVHGCHVHVVGMMFVRAGLATSDGRTQARYTPIN